MDTYQEQLRLLKIRDLAMQLQGFLDKADTSSTNQHFMATADNLCAELISYFNHLFPFENP